MCCLEHGGTGNRVVEARLVPMVSNVEDATIGIACRAAGVDATAIDSSESYATGARAISPGNT